ncbi:uncharacterized protein FIBRA_08357 [Fibroporia radiculosa]|uniref:Zn(2)-C6 fungal-type domain-containing protein n=1 Tax=Fibroporia radiculosa TaxID=599839 RepID=J4GH66_9APHY|nr:uncharacterized protein FIBRA_08357 [Fibroporia radiculosa]CCM06108.1 predicted protein [Fibroporia radiculosa]
MTSHLLPPGAISDDSSDSDSPATPSVEIFPPYYYWNSPAHDVEHAPQFVDRVAAGVQVAPFGYGQEFPATDFAVSDGGVAFGDVNRAGYHLLDSTFVDASSKTFYNPSVPLLSADLRASHDGSRYNEAVPCLDATLWSSGQYSSDYYDHLGQDYTRPHDLDALNEVSERNILRCHATRTLENWHHSNRYAGYSRECTGSQSHPNLNRAPQSTGSGYVHDQYYGYGEHVNDGCLPDGDVMDVPAMYYTSDVGSPVSQGDCFQDHELGVVSPSDPTSHYSSSQFDRGACGTAALQAHNQAFGSVRATNNFTPCGESMNTLDQYNSFGTEAVRMRSADAYSRPQSSVAMPPLDPNVLYCDRGLPSHRSIDCDPGDRVPSPPRRSYVFPRFDRNNIYEHPPPDLSHIHAPQPQAHHALAHGVKHEATDEPLLETLPSSSRTLLISGPSPAPARLAATPEEDTPKKPLTLACFFCRKRKIACGSPPPGRKDRTCNQCARRKLKCVYPEVSRRGMRPKLMYEKDSLPVHIPVIVS